MTSKQHIHTLQSMELGTCKIDEPMYKHTTYRVGGPCRLFISVENEQNLKRLMAYLKEHAIPYFIIGNGSNLLFSDGLFDGVVISLAGEFNQFSINGLTVKAGAGVSIIYLASAVCKEGLSGLEFAGGIPATMGGAVYMNAGAYLSEMSRIVTGVTYLDENGEIAHLEKEALAFSYRHSVFQKHPDWVILSVDLLLEPKDTEAISDLMDRRKEKRMSTQPWNKPSAGSVFQNPEGNAAWRLIDDCGLRGYEIGGASFSMKHSNFIVNNGYASAKDIRDLIELGKARVKEKFGIDLHTEVRLVNW